MKRVVKIFLGLKYQPTLLPLSPHVTKLSRYVTTGSLFHTQRVMEYRVNHTYHSLHNYIIILMELAEYIHSAPATPRKKP